MNSAKLKLGFIPVAIPTPRVSVEALLDYEKRHSIQHASPWWTVLPLIAPLEKDEDLRNQALVDRGWMARFDVNYPVKPRWLFDGAQQFPELKLFLEQLPFRHLAHCNILRQNQAVPPHIDYDPRLEAGPTGVLADCEPASYKIILHGSNLNSFYICDPGAGDRHVFPTYPEGFECFAISDGHYLHGAEYFPGEPKYIVSIFGLLDKGAHARLIAESLLRFGKHAIWLQESNYRPEDMTLGGPPQVQDALT
jgi:hypothetical protein